MPSKHLISFYIIYLVAWPHWLVYWNESSRRVIRKLDSDGHGVLNIFRMGIQTSMTYFVFYLLGQSIAHPTLTTPSPLNFVKILLIDCFKRTGVKTNIAV